MSEKTILFLVGLTIGFASFAAVGSVTSLVIAQVQERVVAHPDGVPTSYAQLPLAPDLVTR